MQSVPPSILTAGGMRQRGDVMSGGSFESSNDFRVHFGLGEATSSGQGRDSLARWQARKRHAAAGVDRYFAIEEGKGVVPSVYDRIAAERSAKANTAHAGK